MNHLHTVVVILITVIVGVIGFFCCAQEAPFPPPAPMPGPAPAPTPSPTPPAPTTEPGEFPDENLEAAIIDALSKKRNEEVTKVELATLTIFVANGRGITNLSGLEYCSNLIELYLQENQICDISLLASLTKLTTLSI